MPKLPRSTPFAIVASVAIAALALAHTVQVIRGVHFKNDNYDFGQPPARYDVSYDWIGVGMYRPGTTYLSVYERDWEREERERANRELREWQATLRGRNLEAAGRYGAARAHYHKMIDRGYGERDFNQMRVEILGQALEQPKMKGLDAFLKRSYLKQSLGDAKAYDPFLRPYVAYMLACGQRDLVAAARFERIARLYPSSPRAEACLIMVARELLAEDREVPVNVISLEDMRRSNSALRALLAKYPRTRFRWSALGWLGRIEYLQGRIASAKSLFRRQLAAAASLREKMNALDSLYQCAYREGKLEDAAITRLRLWVIAPLSLRYNAKADFKVTLASMDKTQAHRFATKLLADPDVFPTYLDVRSDVTNASNVQRRNTARLAEAWVKRHPESQKCEYVLARAAEAWYGQKVYRKARQLARQVLSSKRLDAMATPLALYVEASCARRSGDLVASRSALKRILEDFPKSYVAGGARESLALVCERLGDLGAALDQYFKLGYEQDVAYMVDARMSLGDLAAYVAKQRAGKQREKLSFALGMRYVRSGRYGDAERVLARIPRRARLALTRPKARDEWDGPTFDDPKSLQDPLKTAHDLAKLDRAVSAANGTDAKAKAMLAKAEYFYAHRNLVLYNASLWRWTRADAFAFSWNHAVSTRDDAEAVKRHHYDHEAMSQSLTLCKKVVSTYPKAKAAPKAAMLGIKSAMRLTDLNPWWRYADPKLPMYTEAERLCRFLVKEHPRSSEAQRARDKLLILKEERTQRAADILEYHRDRDWPGF